MSLAVREEIFLREEYVKKCQQLGVKPLLANDPDYRKHIAKVNAEHYSIWKQNKRVDVI